MLAEISIYLSIYSHIVLVIMRCLAMRSLYTICPTYQNLKELVMHVKKYLIKFEIIVSKM